MAGVYYELSCPSTGRNAQIEHAYGKSEAWYLTVYEQNPDGSDTSVYFGVFGDAPSSYATLRHFGQFWELSRGFAEFPPLFPSDMVARELEVV